MKLDLKYVLISLSVIALPCYHAGAQSVCANIVQDIIVQRKIATAGTWANLRKHQGSINFESAAMLSAAEQGLAKQSPPKDLCPSGCAPADRPEVIFQSIPAKYATTSAETERCESLLKQTEREPFRYPDRKFNSLDDLNSWFSDFSQGSGTDGRDLYKRCDGACSPRYKNIIRVEQNGPRTLTAEVQCGTPRDKDDNNYELSYGYRWHCSTT